MLCGLVSGWLLLDMAVFGTPRGERATPQRVDEDRHRLRLHPSAVPAKVDGRAPPEPPRGEPTAGRSGSASPSPVHPRRGAGVVEITSFHPRPAEKWQGALVPNAPSAMPECDTSDRCGLALACRDGLCGACLGDDDCAEGERCVLDHCLQANNVECTTRKDCAEQEVCLFRDEDSPGPRNNQNLRSVCWSREHPGMEQPAMPSAEQNDAYDPTQQVILVDVDDMLSGLRAGGDD